MAINEVNHTREKVLIRMVAETADNNVVTISGKVTTELKYSHEIYGEGFYQFLLEAPRLSDSSDSISVTISERLIGSRGLQPGTAVSIEGQFRSYNSFGESGNKLLLTVFARELSYSDDDSQNKNFNKIFLNGYICKKPIYRSTPFGREITDLLIAVNRAYNKSDYIPCISWGRNARFCSSLNVGDNIKIWGRIQSRTYQKKMPDGTISSRVAYEVSLAKLELTSVVRPGHEQASEPVGADAVSGGAEGAANGGANGGTNGGAMDNIIVAASAATVAAVSAAASTAEPVAASIAASAGTSVAASAAASITAGGNMADGYMNIPNPASVEMKSAVN